jgi:hypothetical protein
MGRIRAGNAIDVVWTDEPGSEAIENMRRIAES